MKNIFYLPNKSCIYNGSVGSCCTNYILRNKSNFLFLLNVRVKDFKIKENNTLTELNLLKKKIKTHELI